MRTLNISITEIVEDIVFAYSPDDIVEAEPLRRWYRVNGINLVMLRTGLKPVKYDVENFDWKNISIKKKMLIWNQSQLEIEQKFYHENL